MMHFVGYHNFERMNQEEGEEPTETGELDAEPPSEDDNRPAYGFVTRKKPERFVGQVIWGIQGQNKPREYYLFKWFIVDGWRALDEERFAAQIYGSRGETFPDGIYLNDQGWFSEFRKVNSNFSLGIQEIAPNFVRHIGALVKASGFPLPPGCEELLQATAPPEEAGAAPTEPAPAEPPEGNPSPERRSVTTNRIQRDSAIMEAVKRLYEYRCQVCRMRLETAGGWYAECAHIRPLGSPHDGPDTLDNVLCLCPNHHILFDKGAFSIESDLRLKGMQGSLRVVDAHHLSKDFVWHHRERIYRSLPSAAT